MRAGALAPGRMAEVAAPPGLVHRAVGVEVNFHRPSEVGAAIGSGQSRHQNSAVATVGVQARYGDIAWANKHWWYRKLHGVAVVSGASH